MSEQPVVRDAGVYRGGQAITRAGYYRLTDGGRRPLARPVIQRRRASNGTGLRDAS